MLKQLLGRRWSLTRSVEVDDADEKESQASAMREEDARLAAEIYSQPEGTGEHTFGSKPSTSSASRSRTYDEGGVDRLSNKVKLRLEHSVFRFWAFYAKGVASMKGLKRRCDKTLVYPFFWQWTLYAARSAYTKKNDHSRALKVLQIAYNKWARFHYRIRAIRLAMLQREVHEKKFLASHMFSWTRILQRRKAQLRARRRWMAFELRQAFFTLFEQVLRIKTLAKTSEWIRNKYILFTLDRALRAWRYNRLLDKKSFTLVQSTIERWINYTMAAHFFVWKDNVFHVSSAPVKLVDDPPLLPPIIHKYGKDLTFTTMPSLPLHDKLLPVKERPAAVSPVKEIQSYLGKLRSLNCQTNRLPSIQKFGSAKHRYDFLVQRQIDAHR
ncbi:hypothetical protein GUITHDRAFT_133356 [Guillardia theta CCMP2712]|uniref:Sfi1 spindle body domain-containing protein n=1 Tax=Guillardia theta (strain CCMP2712) TaxID=905079 RepID=L1JWK0_GUITC|nr:hypothetical protein GUITHDRAFT_133356 [Guillardia theta CCMP2712]EKX52951.1 hypothetical protein GUITHDRAFT_133356 [Guillardia theta CCMP2712]|eukprot:XP_005839931.1 hypothetical protein GUITHDRAFT_133356 [Guillardia theta CCMP2712]